MDGKRFHRLVIAEKIFFYISESVRATGTEDRRNSRRLAKVPWNLDFRVIISVSVKKFHSLFESIIVVGVFRIRHEKTTSR